MNQQDFDAILLGQLAILCVMLFILAFDIVDFSGKDDDKKG